MSTSVSEWNATTAELIARQEEEAWAAYEAEKRKDYPDVPSEEAIMAELPPEAFVGDDEDDYEEVDRNPLGGFSRFKVTDAGPAHSYPSGKEGHTTKERRYNPTTKKTDAEKIHGKSRGSSYEQKKQAGLPPTIEESST